MSQKLNKTNYPDEIRQNSNLKYLFQKNKKIFAYLNGIDKRYHINYLKFYLKMSHNETKSNILKKHFGVKNKKLQETILYVWVNRVAKMKGTRCG